MLDLKIQIKQYRTTVYAYPKDEAGSQQAFSGVAQTINILTHEASTGSVTTL